MEVEQDTSDSNYMKSIINQLTIWSFVFDNYLRFDPAYAGCYFKHCAFARDIYE